jgi:hypothetical protein
MKAFRPIQKTVSLRHGPPPPKDLSTAALAEWESVNVQVLDVVVRPMPIGKSELIGAWIPDAPQRPKLDSSGRAIHSAAGPVMEDDPTAEYAREKARRFARIGVQLGSQLETPYPADGAPVAAWVAYAEAVQAELRAAEFTTGDVTQIIIAMNEVNGGGGDLGNS